MFNGLPPRLSLRGTAHPHTHGYRELGVHRRLGTLIGGVSASFFTLKSSATSSLSGQGILKRASWAGRVSLAHSLTPNLTRPRG